MAFVHSSSSRLLMNDSSQSASIKSWSATSSRKNAETTAIVDSGVKSIPGLFEGEFKLEGYFDATAGGLYDTVRTTPGTDNDMLVTVWPEGGTIGNPAIFAACDTEGFEVEAGVDDAVSITVEAKADNMVDIGTSHKDLSAETATGNKTSVDNAASTANGGAAILHVTAVTGSSPTLIVKIQHSTDNSTFADLITFTTATAATYERKEVAAGTTVNRYTRASQTLGGSSPNFTYGVSFARR